MFQNQIQVALQRRNHETLRYESQQTHVAVAALGDYLVSQSSQQDWAMTYNNQKPKLDDEMIIMGLGYASSLLVTICWVATLVL